jgi:hypothetical protein
LESGASPTAHDAERLTALQQRFDAAVGTVGAELERLQQPSRPEARSAEDEAQLAQLFERRDELDGQVARKNEELQRFSNSLRMFRTHVDILAAAALPTGGLQHSGAAQSQGGSSLPNAMETS